MTRLELLRLRATDDLYDFMRWLQGQGGTVIIQQPTGGWLNLNTAVDQRRLAERYVKDAMGEYVTKGTD